MLSELLNVCTILATEISFSLSGGGFSFISLMGLFAALLAVDDTGTRTGGGEERWTLNIGSE
jgi:hypothetical protein